MLVDVKKIRKTMKITQSDLAKECGVTLRTIQNWEKGETIPSSMQKLLQNIFEQYETNSQSVSENTNNISSNNINSNDAINSITKLFKNQLEIKDTQLAKKDEQIDRLLSLLEKK